MVTLPERFEFKTIRCMKPGQIAYTAPWALLVDLDGNCFINLDQATNPVQEFNYRMKVECTQDGYVVYCSDFVQETPHKWKRSNHVHDYLVTPVFDIV